MTVEAFRKLALSMPHAVEGAHMDHPDFRVGGKIFASLFVREGVTRGMLKLTLEAQERWIHEQPAVFEPVPGGWGKKGATQVHLSAAKAAGLREAMFSAWASTAPKRYLDEREE